METLEMSEMSDCCIVPPLTETSTCIESGSSFTATELVGLVRGMTRGVVTLNDVETDDDKLASVAVNV